MADNNSSQIPLIIDLFTPEILGAFWITEKKLSRDSVGFNEFNYLFDGLISLHIYGQENSLNEINKNSFFTHNFEKLLFLVHVQNSKKSFDYIYEHIDVIKHNQAENRRKILILNDSNVGFKENLEKKYPQFIFENITLS